MVVYDLRVLKRERPFIIHITLLKMTQIPPQYTSRPKVFSYQLSKLTIVVYCGDMSMPIKKAIVTFAQVKDSWHNDPNLVHKRGQ